jgi:hypothetical protein
MVIAGDLNGDGKLDLAMCSGGTSPVMRVVSISLPLGSSAITPSILGSAGFRATTSSALSGLSHHPIGHHACCLHGARELRDHWRSNQNGKQPMVG